MNHEHRDGALADTEEYDVSGGTAVASLVPGVTLDSHPTDTRSMLAEIESLKAEVARLQRDLAEMRAAALASEATELGRTLLVYVLDVLCALLLPQRGHTLIFDPVAGVTRHEVKEAQATVGPLQMALERPTLDRALRGRAGRLSTRYESALWLPIKHGSDVALILCLRRAPTDPFSSRDQEFGEVLGPLIISAMQTGHRLFDLNADQDALRTLSSTLSARIRMGGGRVANQARDAERLSQSFNMEQQERSAVRLAAILHDIGTVDLAEDLLQKEGPLSGDEVAQMREHPIFGSEIVRQVSGMESVIPLVLHHHERWDGAGYPSGLAAGAIPLGARIVAVVDAFHAMTSARPYRQPRSVGDALHELRGCAGTQFDPRVVDEFVRLVREGS